MATVDRGDCGANRGRRQHITGKMNILALVALGKQQARQSDQGTAIEKRWTRTSADP